jgi:hypothetical protein
MHCIGQCADYGKVTAILFADPAMKNFHKTDSFLKTHSFVGSHLELSLPHTKKMCRRGGEQFFELWFVTCHSGLAFSAGLENLVSCPSESKGQSVMSHFAKKFGVLLNLQYITCTQANFLKKTCLWCGKVYFPNKNTAMLSYASNKTTCASSKIIWSGLVRSGGDYINKKKQQKKLSKIF